MAVTVLGEHLLRFQSCLQLKPSKRRWLLCVRQDTEMKWTIFLTPGIPNFECVWMGKLWELHQVRKSSVVLRLLHKRLWWSPSFASQPCSYTHTRYRFESLNNIEWSVNNWWPLSVPSHICGWVSLVFLSVVIWTHSWKTCVLVQCSNHCGIIMSCLT